MAAAAPPAPSDARRLRDAINVALYNVLPLDVRRIIGELSTRAMYLEGYERVLRQIDLVDTHSDDLYWKISNFNLNSLLVSSYIHSPWRFPHLARDGHSSRVTRFLRQVEQAQRDNYTAEMIRHDYEYNLIV